MTDLLVAGTRVLVQDPEFSACGLVGAYVVHVYDGGAGGKRVIARLDKPEPVRERVFYAAEIMEYNVGDDYHADGNRCAVPTAEARKRSCVRLARLVLLTTDTRKSPVQSADVCSSLSRRGSWG